MEKLGKRPLYVSPGWPKRANEAKSVRLLENTPGTLSNVKGEINCTLNQYGARVAIPVIHPDLGEIHSLIGVFGAYADWSIQLFPREIYTER